MFQNRISTGFPVAKSLAILASGLVLGLFIVALSVSLLNAIPGLDKVSALWISTIVQDLFVFILPAVMLGLLVAGRPMRFLGLSKAPSLLGALGIIVILVAATPALNWTVEWNASMTLPDSLKPLEDWMRMQEEAAQRTTDALMSSTSIWGLLATVATVGIVTGLGEETFFRGALQRVFKEGMRNKHLAVWIAAFVFSTLHFQFYGFVPRMLLGAIFGYAYLWSGSLWVPVIAHAYNNSSVVVMTWLQKAGMASAEASEVGASSPWLAVSSAVLAIVLMLVYRKLLENGRR